MRWERGIALLDRHLARLQNAAATLDFAFDDSVIRDAIHRLETQFEDHHAHRLRLTLDRAGGTHVTAELLDADTVPFRQAVVHPQRANSAERLRSFKTTLREAYEVPYQLAKASGYDEAILLNERGEVIEGTRTNVWARHDGRWLTPPLESGCLGGVYREHLLETWENAFETILGMDDLINAEEVGVSNAVHGFLPVELIVDP